MAFVRENFFPLKKKIALLITGIKFHEKGQDSLTFCIYFLRDSTEHMFDTCTLGKSRDVRPLYNYNTKTCFSSVVSSTQLT